MRNFAHDEYHIDEYLTGTNAVVAVLAYTGYDMEVPFPSSTPPNFNFFYNSLIFIILGCYDYQ